MPMFESREQLAERMQTLIGDRTDDDALNFIKDALDTYDHHASNPDENHITKAEHDRLMQEADTNWRKRYRDTFFGTPDSSFADNNSDKSKPDPANNIAGGTKNNPASFDDLFGN